MATNVRIIDSTGLRKDQELIARVDVQAKKELRTRTNMLKVLIEEALQRREQADLESERAASVRC